MSRTWTDEDLKLAVESSKNMAAVCKYLGLKPGGNYPTLYKHIKRLNLSISHFSSERNQSALLSLNSVLVKDSTYQNTGSLKRRLLKQGLLRYSCYECGISTWREKPLALQLDHIDGNRANNTIENLRLICPNCDSQQPTYRGKKRKICNFKEGCDKNQVPE